MIRENMFNHTQSVKNLNDNLLDLNFNDNGRNRDMDRDMLGQNQTGINNNEVDF